MHIIKLRRTISKTKLIMKSAQRMRKWNTMFFTNAEAVCATETLIDVRMQQYVGLTAVTSSDTPYGVALLIVAPLLTFILNDLTCNCIVNYISFDTDILNVIVMSSAFHQVFNFIVSTFCRLTSFYLVFHKFFTH